MSSADSICKQFGGRHFVGPDLDTNSLTLLVFREQFFENANFVKKKIRLKKTDTLTNSVVSEV